MLGITVELLITDRPSERYPSVGYGFEIPTAGVLSGVPTGLVPWDGDFGTIVANQLDARGLDKTDFLSLYETAVSEWLGRAFSVGKVQLPVVFASPKQAFSSYWYALPNKVKANLLQACGGGGPDIVPDNTPPPPNITFARYPLPFVSFSRSGIGSRDGNNSVPMRNLGFLDRDRLKTGWSKFPTPYKMDFQISVWTKYRAMHNWAFSVYESAFSQGIGYLSVPNQLANDGEPILGAIFSKGFEEATEEATEQTEGIFRWVFRVEIEARRFYEVRAAPVSQDVSVTVTEIHNNGAGSTRLNG